MVGVCVRTEESGVFDDPVLYHRDCDDCDLDDLLYSGGVLTGEISVSGKKSIYAVLPADQCIPKAGHLHFHRRFILQIRTDGNICRSNYHSHDQLHDVYGMAALECVPQRTPVATLYTFLGSMEEAQGTMLVGLARIQTMPVAMYGIVLDSSAIQIGAVFAILLIIPSALLIFVMRKYIGPDAIAGGFKMK